MEAIRICDDDWKVCEENGWSRDEILILCDEK